MKQIVLLFALLAFSSAFQRKIFADHVHQLGWQIDSDVHPDTIVKFSIHLKNRNVEKLDRIFWEVSDPSHPNYGKHKTMKEIDRLTQPSPLSFQKVAEFLKKIEGDPFTVIVKRASHFQVETPAANVQNLLQTSLKRWNHTLSGSSAIRTFGEASIPIHLDEHIELISGLSQFHVPKKHGKKVSMEKMEERKDRGGYFRGFNSTVQSLRKFYNIDVNPVKNNRTSQAILAFNDFFSDVALKQFYKWNNISDGTQPIITGHDCLTANPPCDEGESDLDVQYMMGLAPGIRTYFVANDNSSWILEALANILPTLPEVPKVISISYGSAELHNCDPPAAPKLCSATDQSNSKYVQLSDFYFKKLGAVGSTVLVSSGDDGSNGTPWESASCPLDNSVYAPDGGAQFNSSGCMQALVSIGGKPYVYPMSYTAGTQLPDAISQFFLAENAVCDAAIDNATFSLHTNCSCDQLIYKTYQVNGSSFTFSKFQYSDSLGRTYAQSWPATSPFVTAVGATTIWGPGNETAASSKVGAVISSGGGFSNYYFAPRYQLRTVQSWNSQQNQGSQRVGGNYSINYRGYPDISLSGHNYLTFGSNLSRGEEHVDGTSASSPSFGAIISLLNDLRYSRGQPSLGFLNVLLYNVLPYINGTYFDTTGGETKCGEKNCCLFGFTGTKGWDPTTGFGTPNFQVIRRSIVREDPPSSSPSSPLKSKPLKYF